MAKKNHGISLDFLHGKGFTKGTDGVWRKEGCPHPNPAGRPDPEPPKRKQKHRTVRATQAAPEYRTVAIITVRTVRPRDYDGLGASSKHYMDALRHCGLFPDDSPKHLEVLAISEPVRSFQEEETLIELFRIPK